MIIKISLFLYPILNFYFTFVWKLKIRKVVNRRMQYKTKKY